MFETWYALYAEFWKLDGDSAFRSKEDMRTVWDGMRADEKIWDMANIQSNLMLKRTQTTL